MADPFPAVQPWMSGPATNTFSQYGEDGVLQQLFAKIGPGSRVAVEFGAWDGIHLSNTRRLIVEDRWSAILIEADAQRYRSLTAAMADRPDVKCLHARVGFGAQDGLDRILEGLVPEGFDLVSIDIDGNDYHVWQAMVRFRPRVVVVEYNPTIPNDVRYVQPPDPGLNRGASLLSVVELARAKGYEPVAATECNLVAVRRDEFSRLGVPPLAMHDLRPFARHLTYIFQFPDGGIGVAGSLQHVWHPMTLSASRIQMLPASLQQYPHDSGPRWRQWLRRQFARRAVRREADASLTGERVRLDEARRG